MAHAVCSHIPLLSFHCLAIPNCKRGLGNVSPRRHRKPGLGKQLSISVKGCCGTVHSQCEGCEKWLNSGFILKVETSEEKAMAPHSSILAWKIPWTEEPCRLQSMGSLRVGHDWATSLSCIGEGNGNPLQCSCLENPRDGGAWWAAVYGVAQSQTRLKRLSSSSSSRDIRIVDAKVWGLNNLEE